MKLKYHIPDLSALRPRSTALSINRIFRGAGPKDIEAYALTMNFVRLVDLSISEYQAGREAIQQFASEHESLALGRGFASAGHFELCMGSIKRAMNFLKSLRGSPSVPQSLKNLLPRSTIVLTGVIEGKITGIRNAIQHLDAKIQRGDIDKGQALSLMPMEEQLELGEHIVSYADLSQWLKELHELSSKLVYYCEESPPESEGSIK